VRKQELNSKMLKKNREKTDDLLDSIMFGIKPSEELKPSSLCGAFEDLSD